MTGSVTLNGQILNHCDSGQVRRLGARARQHDLRGGHAA